jgi:hypothetical protein
MMLHDLEYETKFYTHTLIVRVKVLKEGFQNG